MKLKSLTTIATILAAVAVGCKDKPSDPSDSPAVQAETPSQAPADLTEAERAFLDGRLNRTIDLLESGSGDATDALLHAYCLLLTGNVDAATALLDVTMRAPHYRDEHLFLGLFAVLTGDLDQSLAELATEREQPRRRFFAQVLYVELLILAERFEAADSESAILIEAYSSEPIVHHTRGHLEQARENWQAAIEAYTRANELGGPNPDIDDGLAAAHIALEKYGEARQAIERCREIFPDYQEIVYQHFRLAHLAPPFSEQPVQALAAEYRRRSLRQDRHAEIEQWLTEP